jgi:hypothetical protein
VIDAAKRSKTFLHGLSKAKVIYWSKASDYREIADDAGVSIVWFSRAAIIKIIYVLLGVFPNEACV